MFDNMSNRKNESDHEGQFQIWELLLVLFGMATVVAVTWFTNYYVQYRYSGFDRSLRAGIIIYSVTLAIPVLWAIVVRLKYCRAQFFWLTHDFAGDLIHIAKVLGLLLGVILIIFVLSYEENTPISERSRSVLWYSSKLSYKEVFAYLIMVGAVAPCVEELFWRGFVLQLLSSKYCFVIANLLQACVFAFSHERGRDFPLVFSLGLILGYSYRRRHNIVAPSVIHGIINTLQVGTTIAYAKYYMLGTFE